MSREMRVRPSRLLGLDPKEELACFCFDRAITAFGEALLSELKGIEAKTKKEAQTKQKKILAKWLPEARSGRPTSRRQ